MVASCVVDGRPVKSGEAKACTFRDGGGGGVGPSAQAQTYPKPRLPRLARPTKPQTKVGRRMLPIDRHRRGVRLKVGRGKAR